MKYRDLIEVASLLGSSLEGERKKILGYSFDSRKVKEGDLFFALKGEKADGHSFLEEISKKKAIGAVVEKSYIGPDFGLPLIKVENVIASLQLLAKDKFRKNPVTTIGVTGSVGKTTTKEFIAHLLSCKYRVVKTPGNANSQVGLPLAMLELPENGQVFVVEMGMSKHGEITALTQIVPPDIAVITKIGRAHMQFFSSIEEIALAKGEIFGHPSTKIGILSKQADGFPFLRKIGSSKKITYGNNEDADYCIQKVSGGWKIVGTDESPVFSLPFEASHLVENFVSAAVVSRKMGLNWNEIIEMAKTLKVAPLRFEKVEKEGIIFINDCYNANPESMRAAIENMPKAQKPHKTVAIIGEMKELGSISKLAHEEIAHLGLGVFDSLLCMGNETKVMVDIFKEAKKPAIFFNSLEELKQGMRETVLVGDVVLIKGSNGNQLWRLLEENTKN